MLLHLLFMAFDYTTVTLYALTESEYISLASTERYSFCCWQATNLTEAL
jgi:hypothetical protein